MGLLNLFSKKSKRDDELIRYHATAKVLVNGSCDVSDTEEILGNLNIPDVKFNDIHIQKRYLALKTVLFTAVITMEPQKRNIFIEIFDDYAKKHDNISNMPDDVKSFYTEFNSIIDSGYLSAFNNVTNSLNSTEREPVQLLMESFSELFAALLDKRDNEQYIEIGKKIFIRHHKRAAHLLKSL